MWPRALAVWLLIVVAESIHGTLRQLFLAPLIGDLPAWQWGGRAARAAAAGD